MVLGYMSADEVYSMFCFPVVENVIVSGLSENFRANLGREVTVATEFFDEPERDSLHLVVDVRLRSPALVVDIPDPLLRQTVISEQAEGIRQCGRNTEVPTNLGCFAPCETSKPR